MKINTSYFTFNAQFSIFNSQRRFVQNSSIAYLRREIFNHYFMKAICLLLFIILVQHTLSAQDIKGEMENWRNYRSGFPFPTIQLEAPDGWHGLDSLVVVGVQLMQLSGGGGTATPVKQVYKSSDGRNGTQAAMLISKEMDSLGVIPGVLSNAQIGVDIMAVMGGGEIMDAISYTGGTLISNRITSIEAWVKYQPSGNDSASVFVAAVLTGRGAGGADSLIAAGATTIGSTNEYIAVTTPLIYTDPTTVPDKLIIGFSSSSGENGTDGSTLYIDDVSIIGGTDAHIKKSSAYEKQYIQCYPNPATGVIHLKSSAGPVTWTAYELTGKQIHQVTFTGTTMADYSIYPPGMYIYRVTDHNGIVLQTGNFTLL